MRQVSASPAEEGRKPVCSTCNDTHRMALGEREVPCTHCPIPCDACWAGMGGCYCATTPCPCSCHRRPLGLVNAAPAEERREATETRGTFACPICGFDRPHTHPRETGLPTERRCRCGYHPCGIWPPSTKPRPPGPPAPVHAFRSDVACVACKSVCMHGPLSEGSQR